MYMYTQASTSKRQSRTHMYTLHSLTLLRQFEASERHTQSFTDSAHKRGYATLHNIVLGQVRLDECTTECAEEFGCKPPEDG
jgi:hypothetical protein